MLKTLANIHDIDLAFVFDESGDLLTSYPKRTEIEEPTLYDMLIKDRRERVDVEEIPSAIVA